jgi:hypothetical protein
MHRLVASQKPRNLLLRPRLQTLSWVHRQLAALRIVVPIDHPGMRSRHPPQNGGEFLGRHRASLRNADNNRFCQGLTTEEQKSRKILPGILECLQYPHSGATLRISPGNGFLNTLWYYHRVLWCGQSTTNVGQKPRFSLRKSTSELFEPSQKARRRPKFAAAGQIRSDLVLHPFQKVITRPPATMNAPPTRIGVVGDWWKRSLATIWAITKKRTT